MRVETGLKRFLLIIIIAGGLCGATVLVARLHAPLTAAPPKPQARDYGPIPPFDIYGLSSKDFTGKTVVISFFASWCGPCQKENPVLIDLSKHATLWGVDTMDDSHHLAQFFIRLGNPFAKVGNDDSGTAGVAWGVTGIPATFIVRNGHIIYRHLGPISSDDEKDEILPLLAVR